MNLHALLHIPVAIYRRFLVPQADITPQPSVDLHAFMGRWYEQARFENGFEMGMDEVTAEYATIDRDSFRVRNQGTSPDGRTHLAEGVARQQKGHTDGALQVSFVPPYRWFASPLLVLHTDPACTECLLAGSGGYYLWLMTREPHPGDEKIRRLIRLARERGFPTEKLRKTRQSGAKPDLPE